MNFRYRLMQFLSGRYGYDGLSGAIFISAAVLAIINVFLRLYAVQMVVYALIVYAIFRTLSRNFEARRRENAWFAKKLSFLRRKSELYKRQKNGSLHIYKKCPKCKAILRLPRRIGKHRTVCPRCSHEFSVNVK